MEPCSLLNRRLAPWSLAVHVQLGRNCGMVAFVTRRPKLAAAAAVALFVVGQVLALAHEAESQHVTCDEHGEQLEAAILEGHDDGCGQQHLIGVKGDTGGEHEDCSILRLLNTSTRTSHAADVQVATLGVDTVALFATIDRPRAVDLLLIAPKTSPPA
jgi:hypothetical protein